VAWRGAWLEVLEALDDDDRRLQGKGRLAGGDG
jgi:hypothetical protein